MVWFFHHYKSSAPPDEMFGFQQVRLDGAEERAGEWLDGEGGFESRPVAPPDS